MSIDITPYTGTNGHHNGHHSLYQYQCTLLPVPMDITPYTSYQCQLTSLPIPIPMDITPYISTN